MVIGFASRALLNTVRSLLKDDVSPLIASIKGTVETVRGTTVFVGETAVSPIIRVYGAVAGARRAVGVITGIVGSRDDE